MAYRITRSHEIDAGHRVCGHRGKCKHLHGHRYRVQFVCEAEQLDQLGMVIDFAVIKERLCHWLDRAWDHRLLLWCHDPLIETLRDADPDGVVSVPFNPTAENMAQHLVEAVGPKALDGSGVTLVACTVHETPNCAATYDLPAG